MNVIGNVWLGSLTFANSKLVTPPCTSRVGQHKQLVNSVCSHVNLVSVDLSDPVPDGWDSAAFCSNLLKASNGDMA